MSKQISCDTCPKTFASGSGLFTHKQMHIGAKKYICLVCNKSFDLNSYLKSHSLIHSGEKLQQCTHCDKSFKRKGDLKTHFLMHTVHANRTRAHTATIQALILPTSKNISRGIPERTYTAAINVIMKRQSQAT